MPSFIRNNLFSFIVLVLLLTLIYFQWRNRKMLESLPKPKRTVDTVWVELRQQTHVVPKVIEKIPFDVNSREVYYVPDTNYAKLVKQYYELVERLLAKNILSDTLKIDSIGYVHVTDTVTDNQIVGRSYVSHLKLPTIKEYVQYPEMPKGMLYWGLGVQMRATYEANSISTGLMYKFKNDVMTGFNIALDNQQRTLFGVHAYWPLTRR